MEPGFGNPRKVSARFVKISTFQDLKTFRWICFFSDSLLFFTSTTIGCRRPSATAITCPDVVTLRFHRPCDQTITQTMSRGNTQTLIYVQQMSSMIHVVQGPPAQPDNMFTPHIVQSFFNPSVQLRFHYQ